MYIQNNPGNRKQAPLFRGSRILLGLLVLLSLQTLAQNKYDVDYSHSRILFNIGHNGFTQMPGMFRGFEVTLDFDGQDIATAKLIVRIDASSVDMFHDKLNGELLGKQFFNTEKFPDIIFTSRKIQMLDQGRARVEGDLELLGVTQALNFELILNKKAPSPRSGRLTQGFSAEGELSRGSHGMDYGSPFISDRVYFQVVAELVRRDK